jgi:hypothetical protein
VLYRDVGCDGALNAPVDTPVTAPITVVEGDRVCLVQQQFVPANVPLGATNLVTLQAFFNYVNASPALSATATRQDITTVSDVALQMLKEVRNVTFTNGGIVPINTLVVNDATPAYTVFLSAACGTPLPASLSTCTITAPAVNGTGGVRWQFLGSLVPALSGTVLYQVRVQ